MLLSAGTRGLGCGRCCERERAARLLAATGLPAAVGADCGCGRERERPMRLLTEIGVSVTAGMDFGCCRERERPPRLLVAAGVSGSTAKGTDSLCCSRLRLLGMLQSAAGTDRRLAVRRS